MEGIKKLIKILSAFGIIVFSLTYLFYFYLPSLNSPEGASLEAKKDIEINQELGFLPISSTTQTVFLPEIKNLEQQQQQWDEGRRKIEEVLNYEVEAALRKKITSKKQVIIPADFQNLAPKVIEINLSEQKLSRWENGQKLDEYLISSGRKGMATPSGVFKILQKIPLAYSRRYRLYMPYWMAFTSSGHGIHELPIFKNGKREGANHLGRPVSHGCVRLGVGPAETVYQWAEIGTPVVIHY